MTEPVVTPAEWTFLLYMDSPASEQLSADQDLLQRLVKIASWSPRFNLVYEIGEDDAVIRGRIVSHELQPLQRLPRVDSIARAITSFVDWAAATFPSRYTALFLRDHGTVLSSRYPKGKPGARSWLIPNVPGPSQSPAGGDRARATKGKSGGRTLNQRSIRTAISGTKRGCVDLYGFDACEMGFAEFAYEVRDVTSYVVSSELIIQVDDFPYDAGIQAATRDLASGPLGVAMAIADAKSELFAATEVGWMDKLAKPLDGLGTYLDPLTTQNLDALMALRKALPTTGDSGVDLGQLLDALRTLAVRGGGSRETLDKLIAEVDRYMSRACLSNGRVLVYGKPAAGLALSFPQLNTLWAMLDYGGLEFARKTAWGSFIFDYLQGVADRYIYPS